MPQIPADHWLNAPLRKPASAKVLDLDVHTTEYIGENIVCGTCNGTGVVTKHTWVCAVTLACPDCKGNQP